MPINLPKQKKSGDEADSKASQVVSGEKEELASEKDRISVNINNLSEKIGEVIEKSKALSVEIQAIYDESQIEYKNKTKSIDELKLLQKESNQKILSYKRKIAEADNDLNILRTKMNGIQEKLNENK